MQILILGNGFDLASGLPTSYYDFLSWRFEQIKKKNNDIDINIKTYIDYIEGKPKYIDTFRNNKDPLLFAGIDGGKTYRDIHSEIKKIIDSARENSINFFDLYFYINKGKNNWCDVESQIKEIVKNINVYDEKPSDSILEGFSNRVFGSSSQISKEDIHMLFLVMFMESCKVVCDWNLYEILMKELRKFEEQFKIYITEISEKVFNSQSYRKVYIDNYKKLIENESTLETTYILNFNYTSILKNLAQIAQRTKELNVHGKFDEITIFGVDQQACNINTDEFIFSKTYRKISENTDSMILPYKVDRSIERQKLIFYGHSLSEADYSYFQSLFDLYDIYNQAFLTFKYSVYDKEKAYEIKKEVFHNITKLIKKYSDTMTNRDHGKNLLHKILLEGRLKIEEITLEDMQYEKNIK